MRYIETKPLSQKNQKFIDMFFQESTFLKIGPYTRSDQTKPNQTQWYTTKASSSCQSLPKKISAQQLHRGLRKLIRKFQNLKNGDFRFFGKRGHQIMKKKKFEGFFGHCGPQEVTKKNFSHFRDGVSKSVNMVSKRRLITLLTVISTWNIF